MVEIQDKEPTVEHAEKGTRVGGFRASPGSFGLWALGLAPRPLWALFPPLPHKVVVHVGPAVVLGHPRERGGPCTHARAQLTGVTVTEENEAGQQLAPTDLRGGREAPGTIRA